LEEFSGVVQTAVPYLISHRDYDAAKTGDVDAGVRIVTDRVKRGKVKFKVDAIVPVLQLDANKRNALPVSYAVLLSQELGVPVLSAVKQCNQVSHTGANAISRILGQPMFDGTIPPRTEVLLVDDVVSYGATIANLRGWLEHQGIVVVGATTLAAAFGATKLIPPGEVMERVLERFPGQVKKLAENLGFEASQFTNRELRYLDEIRTPERFERLLRASEKVRNLTQALSLETVRSTLESKSSNEHTGPL
jgi:hypothetical protein